MTAFLTKMVAYKTWANAVTFDAVATLPPGEDQRVRQTRWESIAYTLSHVAVVDDIFRHHLLGRPHGYTFRNVPDRPAMAQIQQRQCDLDGWFAGLAASLDDAAAAQIVEFEFVGGGRGAMSRADMLMHVVNHGTYHRGLVSDMMCQIPAEMPVNDLTVFLRDNWTPRTGAAPP